MIKETILSIKWIYYFVQINKSDFIFHFGTRKSILTSKTIFAKQNNGIDSLSISYNYHETKLYLSKAVKLYLNHYHRVSQCNINNVTLCEIK